MDKSRENTPVEEVKSNEPTISEVAEGQPVQAEQPKEETIGEVLKEESKKDDSVPLATFLEMKNSNKELQKQMNELKESIEKGASKKEVTQSMKDLAEQHGVDIDLLSDIVSTVRTQVESEVEGKVNEKLKPLQDKERAAQVDAIFQTQFARSMERLPELKDIVQPQVIKSLSQIPANQNKTFTQLIEETYGHLVQGRRSLDEGSTRAGRDDSMEVDMVKAKKDPAYFKEVMSDPNLKAKYNKDLASRVQSYI